MPLLWAQGPRESQARLHCNHGRCRQGAAICWRALLPWRGPVPGGLRLRALPGEDCCIHLLLQGFRGARGRVSSPAIPHGLSLSPATLSVCARPSKALGVFSGPLAHAIGNLCSFCVWILRWASPFMMFEDRPPSCLAFLPCYWCVYLSAASFYRRLAAAGGGQT